MTHELLPPTIPARFTGLEDADDDAQLLLSLEKSAA
jgi:hypothetical protein